MSRTWKHFGLATLVLALILAGTGLAQDQVKPPPTPPRSEDDLKSLIGEMKQLKVQLNRDLGEINERLKTLESGPLKETLKLPSLEGDISKLNKAINEMITRLDNLQTSYQQLADRVRSAPRTAYSPTEPRANGTTGAIRLQNRSGVSATVVVDNRGYVLGPYETRLLENRPLGSFTYEVLADSFGVIQAPVNRTLTADEVFVIQINPSR